MLDREEYIEQAHFFRTLKSRIEEGIPTQDLLSSVQEEILATTKLPMALDFMAGELKMQGVFGTAMAKLPHYFTAFQSFVVGEAERVQGQFDLRLAAGNPGSRSQLSSRGSYSAGLVSVSIRVDRPQSPGLRRRSDRDGAGSDLRRRLARMDLDRPAASRLGRHCRPDLRSQRPPPGTARATGESGRRPAAGGFVPDHARDVSRLANRRKDPFLLFAALHRQLGYPEVPRRQPIDQTPEIIPGLLRRVERMETRLKLLEEEQRGGIDISRFYGPVPPEQTDNAP